MLIIDDGDDADEDGDNNEADTYDDNAIATSNVVGTWASNDVDDGENNIDGGDDD